MAITNSPYLGVAFARRLLGVLSAFQLLKWPKAFDLREAGLRREVAVDVDDQVGCSARIHADIPRAIGGTMAALPTTFPPTAFRVAATGTESPAGYAVKYIEGPPEGTTAVRLSEYAFAVLGMLHALDNIGKSREAAATSAGGPNDPLKPFPRCLPPGTVSWDKSIVLPRFPVVQSSH